MKSLTLHLFGEPLQFFPTGPTHWDFWLDIGSLKTWPASGRTQAAEEVLTGLPVVGSVSGLAVGHVLITIPWSMRLITANLIGVDRSVEEAALSLGASPLVAALKVTLPLIWPGMVAAALFSFVVSFGNLEISLLLVTPGQTTLPIAILQYLQWKIDPTIAAVSALQIAVIGSGLLITDRFVSLAKVVQR